MCNIEAEKFKSSSKIISLILCYVSLPVEKPWFHGKLEREQATKILRSAGMEEG